MIAPVGIPQPVSRPLQARLFAADTRSRPMIEGLPVAKRRPRALPVGSALKKTASRDSRNRLGNPQAPSQASRVRPCAANSRSQPWSEGIRVAKRRPHHSPAGSAPKKTASRDSRYRLGDLKTPSRASRARPCAADTRSLDPHRKGRLSHPRQMKATRKTRKRRPASPRKRTPIAAEWPPTHRKMTDAKTERCRRIDCSIIDASTMNG